RFALLGSTIYLPELYLYLGRAELAAGDLAAASEAAARSLDYARTSNAQNQAAVALRLQAEIALARGQAETARQLLLDSREMLANLGEALELAGTEAVLARC